jgi:hypothetical protein
MRCMACGAEMILMNVNRDDTMAVLGFEHHTFRCSACYEAERRLVFIKDGRETEAEPLPVHPEPPIVLASAVHHERMAAPGHFSAVQRAHASCAQALMAVMRHVAYRALFMRLIARAVASTLAVLRAMGVELSFARERTAVRLLAAAYRYSSAAGRTCIMGATFPIRLVARILIRLFPSDDQITAMEDVALANVGDNVVFE